MEWLSRTVRSQCGHLGAGTPSAAGLVQSLGQKQGPGPVVVGLPGQKARLILNIPEQAPGTGGAALGDLGDHLLKHGLAEPQGKAVEVVQEVGGRVLGALGLVAGPADFTTGAVKPVARGLAVAAAAARPSRVGASPAA